MSNITYKSGYKYQLEAQYVIKLPFPVPMVQEEEEYILTTSDNFLMIKKGYAWDGPSGPTIDTKSFMRGSLVHDALYQLMGLNLLEPDKYRILADKFLIDICKEDGMSAIRRAWVYAGVRFGGGDAARKHKPVETAP